MGYRDNEQLKNEQKEPLQPRNRWSSKKPRAIFQRSVRNDIFSSKNVVDRAEAVAESLCGMLKQGDTSSTKKEARTFRLDESFVVNELREWRVSR